MTIDILGQTLLTPDQRRTKPSEGLRVSNVPEAPGLAPQVKFRFLTDRGARPLTTYVF